MEAKRAVQPLGCVIQLVARSSQWGLHTPIQSTWPGRDSRNRLKRSTIAPLVAETKNMTKCHGFLSVLLLGFAVLASFGSDWPQFRGPNRDGVSRETGLRKKWPEGGPPLLWAYADAGVGYAGPAVVGDRLYMSGG